MLTTTTRAFGSPSRYIQGCGVLDHLKDYAADFGSRVFAIIDPYFFKSLSEKFEAAFAGGDLEIVCAVFGGQTTKAELSRLSALAKEAGCDVVVGVGGGKTIDAAKYTGIQTQSAIIIAPTSAATDAPTSALSVTYTPEGVHDETIYFKKNPDLILVDSKVIVTAPIRLLVSGMGDALSTYFEARAHLESNTANRIGKGYKTTLAGMAVSELCYQVLLEDGLKAKLAAERGVVTEALENIIEANTLLSGLGVECVGCAAAHSYNSGFSALEACRRYTHGEIVAFGTLCQLVLENRPSEEIETVLNFSESVGLPTTLADIGLTDPTEADLRLVARRASAAKHIVAEPVTITEDILYDAILAADALGRHHRQTEAK
ncbi:MAG: glycerol dehydrogenase [Eubacterium sp.]|nr:glycerol dehydrogenase [Eubacterium sp.]